jgi:hypothetical protein
MRAIGAWVIIYGIAAGTVILLTLYVAAVAWPGGGSTAYYIYSIAGAVSAFAILAGFLPLLIGGALLLSFKRRGKIISLIGMGLYLIPAAGVIVMTCAALAMERTDLWAHVGIVIGEMVLFVLPVMFIVNKLRLL